ncbi:glycine oxidase ThiO [Kutzneria buriramensis]|uniref:glycine oxidase n=1 Tax=Kutzneria buriramensis TaxID=1045776 RepID=A0A3E0HUY7_9PSEU|nr:glycine oxidase ThiO [Kutzneria buriramensis]REH50342.1 glycine oxidase [Kutzneria buriramensis]
MKVAVVGGGVVGLSVAWAAAEAGHQVVLIDAAPGSGASWVAGGMLAPVTEAWPGEEHVLALGSASLDRWPDFAARLEKKGGLREEGTLAVAVDAADREELDGVADYLARLGREVRRLTAREVRRLEPTLGMSVRSGLSVPGDLAVDNRVLLASLRKAATDAGAQPIAVAARSVSAGEVLLVNGSTVACDAVVLAAGARSGGLYEGLAKVVRPVKGEILRLKARPGALDPPTRTVRALVEGRHVYLVPREGRGLVLGATQYETGFDTDVTVAGVRDLLRDAERVLPGIGEYAVVECAAGLRPGSPDNLPLLGWLEPGVLAATGHHRNGILLAPITAEAVVDLLAGREPPEPARAADPARLLDVTNGGG